MCFCSIEIEQVRFASEIAQDLLQLLVHISITLPGEKKKKNTD